MAKSDKNPAKSTAPAAATPVAGQPVAEKKKLTGGIDKRVTYPNLQVDGKDVVLEALPTDFDPKKHKPIAKKYFAKESVFFNLRAEELEAKAKRMRAAAIESEKTGNVKDKKSAKKLIAAQKRIAELRAKLAADGVDVEALLAGIADAPKTETPVAAS